MSGDRLRSGVFRVRRGRPAWAVPVLLFLAVLIVAALAFNLANLDTGGEAIPDVPDAGGTPPTAVGAIVPDPYAGLFLFAVVGFLVIGAAIVLFRRRVHAKREPKPFSWWDILSSVVGFALVLALLLGWPRILAAFRPGATVASPAGAGAANNTAWPVAAGAPVALFLAASVFGALLVLVYLLRRGAGASEMDSDLADESLVGRRAADEAVQTAISELELGGDVRAAILACFQRFCALVGSRGIAGQLALTPRELKGLAIERLHVAPDASETLTSLFEEARYSEHRLGEEARSRALDSLARIRSALEA